MIREFLSKYKWYLIGLFTLYIAISVWLFFLTEAPQSVPFEYQVH